MSYDFDTAVNEWSRIPVDDFDYLTGAEILNMTLTQRQALLQWAWTMRFAGWRNRGGLLEKFMGGFPVAGKLVCDFGCGLGLDALWFVRNGAATILADINPVTLAMANQTICLMADVTAKQLCVIGKDYPWFTLREKVDLFWSLGCLHHTPNASGILKRACEQLNPGGECRVVLYSDRLWEKQMDCKPPANTCEHPRFAEFVRKNDTVGQYADWYNEVKLTDLVGGFASVASCTYIGDKFVAAVIKQNE